MAANFVQVPPNSTGLKVDTNELTVGANVVERQNITLADPAIAANISNVVAGTNPTLFYLADASAPLDGYKVTYGACANGLSAGTAATTDVLTLFGTASKTVRIWQIGVAGTAATAATTLPILIRVCSAAPTGGTATTLTNVPFDSLDPAGTAVAKFYTATPTAATYIGTVAGGVVDLPITGTGTTPFPFVWVPPIGGRALVLRGVTQGISVTFNTATPANAQVLQAWFVWSEE